MAKKKFELSRKHKVYLVSGAILVFILALIFFYVIHLQIVKGQVLWGEGNVYQMAFRHMLLHPFDIVPFPFEVVKTGLLFLFFGAVVVFMYTYKLKLMRHDNRDTIAGDAKWMTDKQLEEYNKILTEPFGEKNSDSDNNMILSDKVKLSMNLQKRSGPSLNNNAVVIGGSGAGKSFRVIGPNIMQRNTSFIVTDPSGGLFHKYGAYLEYYGYRVKVFNLDKMELSNHYNPFRYIHSDKDIEVLVTMIITNTTSPDAGKGDQFWEKCETALFCALIAYLYHYGKPSEQTFSNMMRLIRAANVDENDSSIESPLDRIFKWVEKEDPESFAWTQYQTFKLGAGKTLKSILISAAVRLQAFDLEIVRKLTDTDDIHLDNMADEKTALFIIVPTGEKTFNFLAGLMYSQLFTQLYRYCENTSKFSQCVLNSDGEVIKVFHAENKNDAKRAKDEAQKFLDALKGGRVEADKGMDVVDEEEHKGGKVTTKKFSFYKILNENNEVVGYRGTEAMAKEALKKMQEGEVVAHSINGTNHGESCPIHVSFLLDEFANTGKIPSFAEKVSTIRKYEISVMIILQSIKQLQNLYKDEWSTITGNCDMLVYLGGGADIDTTKWLVELMGKKTVRAMNESYSKGGGSTSIQTQGIELYSMSQLRTMPNIKCIVMPRGYNPVFGDMYDTPHHPTWPIAEKMPNYTYSEKRHAKLRAFFGEVDEMSGGQEALGDHGSMQPESPADEGIRTERNEQSQKLAEEVQDNRTPEGNPVISDINDIKTSSEEMPRDDVFGLDPNEGPMDESINSMVSDDILSFSYSDEDMDFSSMPMG